MTTTDYGHYPAPVEPSAPVAQAEMSTPDLLSLIFAVFGAGILAVILGAVGMSRAKDSGKTQHPVGKVGLIFGIIESGLWMLAIGFWAVLLFGASGATTHHTSQSTVQTQPTAADVDARYTELVKAGLDPAHRDDAAVNASAVGQAVCTTLDQGYSKFQVMGQLISGYNTVTGGRHGQLSYYEAGYIVGTATGIYCPNHNSDPITGR